MDTISAVEGTILDDDTVVKALEDLKGEAGDVAKEVRTNTAAVLVSSSAGTAFICAVSTEQETPTVVASCTL